MLEQLLRQLKGDSRDMTMEELTNLSKSLTHLPPQGPVRRGIVSDLGKLMGLQTIWPHKAHVIR
jgi:hypothetical protein